MPFPQAVKLQAKQRANFRCVVCHEPWVEVHHIIPEAQDGPDTLDNAAPLCATCHHRYGDNPALRKQLREMRDWWWQLCADTAATSAFVQLSRQLDELRADSLSGHRDQSHVLGQVKTLLINHFRSAQEAIDSTSTVGQALAASSSYSTGAAANVYCPKCKTAYGLVNSDRCPQCGGPFSSRRGFWGVGV